MEYSLKQKRIWNVFQKEKLCVLNILHQIASLQNRISDDCERYFKMGLSLDSNCANTNFRNEKDADNFYFCLKMIFINQRYGIWLQAKQQHSDVPPNRWDFSFLELIRKAVKYETDQEVKSGYLHALRASEANHDLWTASIKEINPLIQFGPGPNLELKEAKVELYKISVSFSTGGKIGLKFILITIVFLKGLKHE